jgi:hypothetical protein
MRSGKMRAAAQAEIDRWLLGETSASELHPVPEGGSGKGAFLLGSTNPTRATMIRRSLRHKIWICDSEALFETGSSPEKSDLGLEDINGNQSAASLLE